MSEHAFCRALLTEVMADVRPHTTAAERKAAWTYDTGLRNREFHGPNGFYWHGRACCGWHARALGWEAWLAKYHPTD